MTTAFVLSYLMSMLLVAYFMGKINGDWDSQVNSDEGGWIVLAILFAPVSLVILLIVAFVYNTYALIRFAYNLGVKARK